MTQLKARLLNLYYTFPIQLIRLQLKHNVLLLSLWAVLFAVTSGQFGASMGLHKLFLDPEYKGVVGFWSFFIIGMAYGSFFIAWNTSIYILNSYRFPFLASLYRPFSKFSFNNCIIPVLFLFFYCYQIIAFQWYNEYTGQYSLLYCLGVISGALIMIVLAMIYFHYTNTDVQSYRKQNRLKLSKVLKAIVVQRKERTVNLKKDGPYKNAWRVDFFLNERFQWRIVRQVGHYNFKLLERVFRQNHANAFVIQSISITLLILMAALVEYEAFRIPAAASLLLLFSILTTVIGALTYWLEEWRVLSLLLAFLLINQMMAWGLFSYQNSAYGLNYGVEPTPYSLGVLDSICSKRQYNEDSKQMLQILENWKAKFEGAGQKRPKMVLVCVSGGGIRASLWSHHVMREADHATQGRLMPHTALITGASGGMWGAGLYRELYYQQQQGKVANLYDKEYINYSAKDLMNSLAFTFLVNDIFIPWVNREVNGHTYRQDRGYSFEQQFIENSQGLMANDLSYYQQAEASAQIPLLFITPLIANDSRLMVISPQPVSFMMRPPFSYQGPTPASKIDAVDYGALFRKHDPMSLRFVTALRMNATFPFIFPSVQMPSQPTINLVDAGFRDNFGLEMATRFAAIFRKWIRANTSGVVIVSVRSYAQAEEISATTSQSLAELFFNPLGPMFAIDALQNYHHDNYVSYLKSKIGYDKVEVVDFVYEPTLLEERASLSLHLTQREKNDILNAITLEENKKSISRLKQLLR